MEQLYIPLRKMAVVAVLSFLGYSATAQSVCGPIVQNFDNTGGSMAGFSSSTFLSSAPGFTFGQTGQNGYLQRCSVSSAGTVYEIISPTYQPVGTPAYIGYGFDLSGAVAVSNINVYFQYIDNNNNINSVLDTIFSHPVYTGTGANATLSICDSFLLSRATGFTPGEDYRIVIELTAASSSNTNQCIVFDNFRTTGSVAAASLPVSFIGFASKRTATGTELIWNVAGEREVQTYIVERSTTGTGFTRIGEVAATNSSAYSFMDNQPVNGLAFYRIKEVDLDGKFRYSTIIRADLARVTGLRAYPSPARDLVTIEHAAATKALLSISTSDGRIVKQVDVKPDMDQTVINISALKAGLYIVRFTDGKGGTESLKLVKE